MGSCPARPLSGEEVLGSCPLLEEPQRVQGWSREAGLACCPSPGRGSRAEDGDESPWEAVRMAAALCGHSCCTPGCPEQPQQLQTSPQASLSPCQTRSKTLLVSHLAPASHQPLAGAVSRPSVLGFVPLPPPPRVPSASPEAFRLRSGVLLICLRWWRRASSDPCRALMIYPVPEAAASCGVAVGWLWGCGAIPVPSPSSTRGSKPRGNSGLTATSEPLGVDGWPESAHR